MVQLTGHAPAVLIGHPLWIRWLRLATEQVAAAAKVREEGERVREAGGDIATAIAAESDHSLLAIAAVAFAIDGFHLSVRERAVDSTLVDTWSKNNTPRSSRIIETLKSGFVMDGRDRTWESRVKSLIKIRDESVHPEEAMNEPQCHPLGLSVAAESVTFGLEAATREVRFARDLIRACLSNPKDATRDLAERFTPTVDALRVLGDS